MKIVFLGTGTSTGNPEIGCQCEVLASTGLDLGRDGRETDIDRLWSGLPLANDNQ